MERTTYRGDFFLSTLLRFLPMITTILLWEAIYAGAGARTLAAETVAIPGLRIFSHLGDALFAPLAARQIVCARTADSGQAPMQTEEEVGP